MMRKVKINAIIKTVTKANPFGTFVISEVFIRYEKGRK